jgi:hypothetical protein
VKTLNSAVMTATNNSSSSTGGGGGSPEGPQFSCLDCAMDFYSAPQLKRHTQYAHRGGEEETQFCQVRLRLGTPGRRYSWRGPIEPNMGPSLAYVLFCTFESINAGFSSFPVRKLLP